MSFQLLIKGGYPKYQRVNTSTQIYTHKMVQLLAGKDIKGAVAPMADSMETDELPPPPLAEAWMRARSTIKMHRN
jgi:hypothetical protein